MKDIAASYVLEVWLEHLPVNVGINIRKVPIADRAIEQAHPISGAARPRQVAEKNGWAPEQPPMGQSFWSAPTRGDLQWEPTRTSS
jgi:hypothetical protein